MSPYHISKLPLARWKTDQGQVHQVTYEELFSKDPEMFDSSFPFEQNEKIESRRDNSLAEYFQLTLFLTIERLKGEKSFWKPFIDYLPACNDTLFTIDDSTTIGPSFTETLISEVQCGDDDIFRWINYGRDVN